VKETLRAVADANVYVSAVRSPNGRCAHLVEQATQGRWRPVISNPLFTELEVVLDRPAFKDLIGEEAIDRFIAGILTISEWAEDSPPSPALSSRDPDDDYLLALAVSAKVDVLVTGDKDLLDLSAFEPPIETPAQFADRLR